MRVLLFCLSLTVFLYEANCASDNKIVKARLESCPGCSLNRLKEVRAFAYEDIPNYDNVEFKKIHGAPPELVFLNSADEEIERIKLSDLNRQECNELLRKRGFLPRTDKEL